VSTQQTSLAPVQKPASPVQPLPAPSVPSTAELCASADRLAQATAQLLAGGGR
jgi:hypothetical protein